VRIHMNIPPKADKWIALIVILGLAEFDYSRAADFQTVSLEWVLVAAVIAVLLAIWYGLWSALAGILARRIRARPSGFPTRSVSNARFVVFTGLVYVLAHTPLYTIKARINLEPAPSSPQSTPPRQPLE
jgi:hypothetical protein